MRTPRSCCCAWEGDDLVITATVVREFPHCAAGAGAEPACGCASAAAGAPARVSGLLFRRSSHGLEEVRRFQAPLFGLCGCSAGFWTAGVVRSDGLEAAVR